MENNNKYKKIIIILSVILVVLLLAFGGLYLYRKITRGNVTSEIIPIQHGSVEENKEVETTKDIATTFYENMVKNRKLIQDNQYGGINMILDKHGDVYYSAESVESNSYDVGQKKEYKIDDYFAGPDYTRFEGYQLNIHDVISMYHSYKGNGGSQVFVFIKADGTIGELKYIGGTEKMIIEEFKETVSGYNNIISVIHDDNFDTTGYKLIDIYGNIFNMAY